MEADEQFLQKRILDLASQSYRNNQYTFTGFLNPSEQDLYFRMKTQISQVETTLFGGTEGCERQVLRFGGLDSLGYEEPFPIVCIEIRPLLLKFADALTHRDFLGALMNLGIDRSTIGDIQVKDKSAYMFCLEKVKDFIVENLVQSRHTSVKCVVLNEIPETVKPVLQQETLIVSSLRLDGLISKLYHLSRSQSLTLFREKKVFLDGRCMENNSGICKEGSVVSVRGYGKFIYTGMVHETKKGNLSIHIERYV